MKMISCISSISKKLIAFTLCALLLSTTTLSVFASDIWDENLPLPKWTYIFRVSGGVMDEPDSSGRYTVGGDVFLRDLNNRVDFSATVQHYNGAWYNTSYKWSVSEYGAASITEPIYLSTGCYRMRLIVKVYSPSGVLLEETTLYTNEVII